MSERDDITNGRVLETGAFQEEEQVRHLLEAAGPRSEVPAQELMAIREVFRAEWREHVRRKQARRPLFDRRFLALAAALALTLGLGWWWSQKIRVEPVILARVASVEGVVTAGTDAVTAGQEIAAGAELATAAGRAALELADGLSLHLDTGSRVRLDSPSSLRLAEGAVYIDSGAGPGGIAVHTPWGVARDIGTRFEVRLLAEALRVRVRDGKVLVEREGASYPADGGEELTLRADGSVNRAPLAAHGEPWEWIRQASPRFDIEGRTLAEFLDWIAGETGWEIRLDETAAGAAAETLHGTYGEATPEEALAIVLKGAGLSHEVADSVVVIRAED